MPHYRTHQLAGIILLALVLWLGTVFTFLPVSLGIVDMAVVIVIILFYSILADIDIGTSKSRKIIFGTALFAIGYCFLFSLNSIGLVITAFLLIIVLFLNHRGRTHSVLASVIFSAPLAYLSPVYMGMGVVAYLSHLVLDKEVKWF